MTFLNVIPVKTGIQNELVSRLRTERQKTVDCLGFRISCLGFLLLVDKYMRPKEARIVRVIVTKSARKVNRSLSAGHYCAEVEEAVTINDALLKSLPTFTLPVRSVANSL